MLLVDMTNMVRSNFYFTPKSQMNVNYSIALTIAATFVLLSRSYGVVLSSLHFHTRCVVYTAIEK